MYLVFAAEVLLPLCVKLGLKILLFCEFSVTSERFKKVYSELVSAQPVYEFEEMFHLPLSLKSSALNH